jgi:hypothetical protein
VDISIPDGSFELFDQGEITFRLLLFLLELFMLLERMLIDISSK